MREGILVMGAWWWCERRRGERERGVKTARGREREEKRLDNVVERGAEWNEEEEKREEKRREKREEKRERKEEKRRSQKMPCCTDRVGREEG